MRVQMMPAIAPGDMPEWAAFGSELSVAFGEAVRELVRRVGERRLVVREEEKEVVSVSSLRSEVWVLVVAMTVKVEVGPIEEVGVDAGSDEDVTAREEDRSKREDDEEVRGSRVEVGVYVVVNDVEVMTSFEGVGAGTTVVVVVVVVVEDEEGTTVVFVRVGMAVDVVLVVFVAVVIVVVVVVTLLVLNGFQSMARMIIVAI
jgi:hypothetical protein